jgi:peptidoglycan/LPS O-acetylase OafA/YrhL
MDNNRLKGIDALRGIAALVVVFYHYFSNYEKNYGHPFESPTLFSYGHYGVDLFFMISGFVIFMTVERNSDFGSFAYSRFSRLFPAYWAAASLTFVVLLIYPLAGREVELSQYLINLSMLQGFLYVKHIDHVYWTLTLEIAFYFWIGFSLLFFKRNYIREGLCVWVLFSLFIQIFNFEISPPKSNLVLLKHIYLFAAGVCIYDVYCQNINRLSIVLSIISIFTLVITKNAEQIYVTFFLAALFVVTIKYRVALLEHQIFQIAGKISYPLYLIHQNIGYVIISIFYTLFGFSLPSAIFAITTAAFTTTVIAYVITMYVEPPARKLLKKAYTQLRIPKGT